MLVYLQAIVLIVLPINKQNLLMVKLLQRRIEHFPIKFFHLRVFRYKFQFQYSELQIFNLINKILWSFIMNFAQNCPESGKKIKNYVFRYCDLIGKGNFARVYKGTNQLTNETVAIKMVSLDDLKSKKLEALVFEQIKILQLVMHPNIIKFYQALQSERNCYIITELCNEGSLEDIIKKNPPLNEKQTQKLILGILSGLKYLREIDVVHRDIKAANILIQNGEVKIADFGLAKIQKQRFRDIHIGSPPFMAPEGLLLNIYSEKTDIWSFGIVIYQILHGQSPFAACTSESDLKYWITRPINQSRFRNDISQELKRFVYRLLEVDDRNRPSVTSLQSDPYIQDISSQRHSITTNMNSSKILNSLRNQQDFDRRILHSSSKFALKKQLGLRQSFDSNTLKIPSFGNEYLNKSAEKPVSYIKREKLIMRGEMPVSNPSIIIRPPQQAYTFEFFHPFLQKTCSSRTNATKQSEQSRQVMDIDRQFSSLFL